MTQENSELMTDQSNEPEQKPEKKYSDEEVQNIIKARVKEAREAAEQDRLKREKQHQEEIARLKSTSSAASSQAAQPTSTTSEPMYSEQEVAAMQQQHDVITKFKSKIEEASEKDPELKKLMKEGNAIPGWTPLFMTHIDNGPAVIKRLLKDKKDHAVFDKIAQGGTEAEMVKFINELSDKVEQSYTKPHSPDYSPSADISDVSDPGQDFDIPDYVRGKN